MPARVAKAASVMMAFGSLQDVHKIHKGIREGVAWLLGANVWGGGRR